MEENQQLASPQETQSAAQTPINQPQTVQASSTETPRKKSPILIPLLIIIALIVLGTTGYFGYQYYRAKNRLVNFLPTPTTKIKPTDIPNFTKPSDNPNSTEGWKTYTNKTFTIKFPTDFDYDSRYSTDPSNMHFDWGEPKNTTPIQAIDITIGYMTGDPNLMNCKTDEDCYQGYEKSFSVNGYNKISTMIDGKLIDGFELSNTNSNILTFQNFYPISHNEKLFAFDIQMTAPSIKQAKQLVPQVNQILSTFKFLK